MAGRRGWTKAARTGRGYPERGRTAVTGALSHAGVSLSTKALIALRRVALSDSATPPVAALPGGFLTRKRGQGIEVADVREYVAGDDIRHLDRGTTARTGRMHIRQFQEERDRVSLLIADFRAPMFWGLQRAFLSVAAAEALVLIGWHLVQNGGRVGLLAITADAPVIIPPRGRTRGMLDVIGGLVQAHSHSLSALQSGQDDGLTLEQALTSTERLTPPGSEVIIASGFDQPGDDLGDRLSRLAHRRTPRLVLITESKTHEMPSGWYPIRLSDGRQKRVYLSGSGSATDTIYRQVARHPALVLNASDPVEDTGRRISVALAERYVA
ncbi:DUF58 domain-containing protein [Rhodobacteraceae bacterium B1Z28]|uniref:DUF58 domain-containing protein n=1 Tax=Ruegeria haliotis TaxID=2747601 RepID=A0ABX2PSH0_9RHOB|nr:DUF58 domain-containing protein [Ruegeria haliotis]NVO56684.1 DUF58 domain-containing protein [Ruegeria haliotis]